MFLDAQREVIKKRIFYGQADRKGGGHCGLNQGVRPSYYNFQISPMTLCTISMYLLEFEHEKVHASYFCGTVATISAHAAQY